MNNATEKQIAATFAEWNRRYREEPDRFLSETETLALTSESLGDSGAKYFLMILADIQAAD